MRLAVIALAFAVLWATPSFAQKGDEPSAAPAQLPAASTQLTIRICNESGRNAFVALVYRSNGQWRSEGWFRVDNGRCEDTVTGDHLRFYGFAEEAGNTDYYWGGSFEHCIWRPGPYDVVIDPNSTTCPNESVMFSEWVADHYGTFTWTLDP
jgi:hypothetical protein